MNTHPSTSTPDTYRRGQVERALWQLSVIGRPAAEEPSSIFRNRIKRLLEIDRERLKERGKKDQVLAFSEDKPEGTGIDVVFSAYDGFILALGLDLLRMGFVQSEVASLMHFLRPKLGTTFDRILRNPPGAERRSLTGRSRSTIRPEDDRRVFLVIERVELSEEFPAFTQGKTAREGAFYREPKVCRGLQEVTDELDRMDSVFRRALVLDLAHTAWNVSRCLAAAPEIKRGRPSTTARSE
jgi:hypothetical protein